MATNPSESDVEAARRQAEASVADTFDSFEAPEVQLPSFEDVERKVPGVEPGAERPIPEPTRVSFRNVKGESLDEDTRVRIMVPAKYITPITMGSGKTELKNFHGIIFPYTPSISFETKADYSSINPTHSNFSVYFYQRSSVGQISINGKFTVQSDADANVYLSTIRLLTALTKMRSGGAGFGDADSGAPPPVCRLFAYGETLLKNVPVAVTSFRMELPDSVDYYTLVNDPFQGTTSVPSVSTLAVTLIPIYSRNEIQNFSVDRQIFGEFKGRGYI